MTDFPSPQEGDLWVAATLVTDHTRKLGLSRLWLLGPGLAIKAEVPTGHFGMVSGLGKDPATGIVYAMDPTARQVSRIGRNGHLLPSQNIAEGRGLGSIAFLKDGSFICGEHLSGPTPPFHGDGRLLHFDADGRLVRLHRPQINGGVSGFLGLTHIAVLSDGHTVAYVSETGNAIYRYDLATAEQAAPLYTRTDPPGMVFGIAALPNDSVLVACGNEVRQIAPNGSIQRHYALPAGRGWSFLSLTRDGTSFWCGDFFSATIAKIDLASGEVQATSSFDLPFGLTSIIEA